MVFLIFEMVGDETICALVGESLAEVPSGDVLFEKKIEETWRGSGKAVSLATLKF